ncbi:MAG: B12-binding domain-containing radical SAM protein [Candidatus Xenobiia bacterium LiM19]
MADDKELKERPSGKDFTTIIIFPPQWTPQNPHYAISSIAGHMRKAGLSVIVKDLNVEFYDEVLTPEYLRLAEQKIHLNYNYLIPACTLSRLIGDTSVERRIDMLKFNRLEEFIKKEISEIKKLSEIILDAKETLRDPRRFYNPLLLAEALAAIDRVLEIISLPYYPARLTFNSFQQPHCLFATHSLMVHAQTPELNMFYDFFSAKTKELEKLKPSLVAISINSFSQVLPGLTMAMMLRRSLPKECLMSIGGNFFTRVKDTLLKRPEFFRNFADVVALGEGEKQTVILAREWASGKDLSKVPNLVYYDRENDKVSFSYAEEPENLDSLGFQDFEGFPMKKYFTPEIVACIQSSKGCYWGKCTFCDSDYGVTMDIKSLDRLIEEMKYLKSRYGIKHFEFIDESIRPDYMKEMAQRFIDDNLDIRWFSNGRTEEAFSREMLELFHRSGNTLILWGFESGCERIMRLINKGIDVNKRYRVLKDSSDAGIWNFAYIFFGFPTETHQEACETIKSICDNKDIIHSYGRSVFTLGKHSLLYGDAEKYGICDIREDGEELSTNYSYRSTSGMSDTEIDAVMKECTDRCSTYYNFSLWYYLRYRENLHLYIAKHGVEYVKNYRLREMHAAAPEIW